MNWQLPLAITFVVAALVYASFQWGRTHEKNKQLDATNTALIEYVEKQKEITDFYGPLFDKIKTAPKNGIDPVIDATIDFLPDPKRKNRGLRPSSETSQTKK